MFYCGIYTQYSLCKWSFIFSFRLGLRKLLTHSFCPVPATILKCRKQRSTFCFFTAPFSVVLFKLSILFRFQAGLLIDLILYFDVLLADGENPRQISVVLNVCSNKLLIIYQYGIVCSSFSLLPCNALIRSNLPCYRCLSRTIFTIEKIDQGRINDSTLKCRGIECDFLNS
ncbi:MAG: hypothetical protein BWY11_01777 [Firmicutes bacterium ADurb.Bin182]|nr:MAG: hypothetical protein BWY11_01777 [Firmicutes bacterium ADurb.Bin182]